MGRPVAAGRPGEGGGGHLGRQEAEAEEGAWEGGGRAVWAERFIHEEERVSREDPWQLWRELRAPGLA